MADITPIHSSTTRWLRAASSRYARRAVEIIEARTRSGVEIGLGFIPTETALKVARSLATDRPVSDDVDRDPLAIGDIPAARLIARTGLPQSFVPWAALMLLQEKDQRWGTVFGWLADNAQARVPTAGLLNEIVGPAGVPLEQLFAPYAPLQSLTLLRDANQDVALPDRRMQFSSELLPWLLGDDLKPAPDHSLRGIVLDLPKAPLEVLVPDPKFGLATRRAAEDGRLILTGAEGSGRALSAQSLVGDAVVIGAQRLPSGAQGERHLRSAVRDACLSDRALIVAQADKIPLHTLIEALANAPVPVILTSESRLELEWPSIAMPALDHSRSLTLWRYGLGDRDERIADRLAHQFRIGAADILRVCDAAAKQDEDGLIQACLSRTVSKLGTYSSKVECRHGWDDLVLPPRQLQSLKSIVQRTRHGHQVFDEWGFGTKLAPNRGFAALFSGPSGAGKTLSASVVAGELGLPLYRVDLSATVSKYIGETEKQLEEIFSAAEAGSACLFFDECDALFGKRSEVSDAHDRYANIETSYLLQRLETHRGIVFMASNYPQNIDEAFTRRIDVTIEFPMPDAALRSVLWERMLPQEAEAEIDAGRLGEQFELSGGSIRNCLLAAAFMAAEEGTKIEMLHCLQAVAQEYEKTGRPLTRADFGESFIHLRPPRTAG